MSYLLSLNVRALKIIINLIKHKTAYKQTKTKKARKKKISNGKTVTYSHIWVFALFVLFDLFVLFVPFVLFVFFVRAKSFRKKNKKFKTALITSFMLLL